MLVTFRTINFKLQNGDNLFYTDVKLVIKLINMEVVSVNWFWCLVKYCSEWTLKPKQYKNITPGNIARISAYYE